MNHVIKRGSVKISKDDETPGIQFIKKHYHKLKEDGLKIMEIKFEEATYYGQTKQNKQGESIRHGLGAIYYQNGRYYEGMWRNGVRHGTGYEKFEVPSSS